MAADHTPAGSSDTGRYKHDDERTPLLRRSDEEVEGTVEELLDHSRSHVWSPASIIGLLVVFVAAMTLADGVSLPSMKRLYESILCYQYYEHHDPSRILLSRAEVRPGALGGVDELLCKIPQVQASLASISGWQLFFDGFPALIMALPIGWAADKYGRKPILVLAGLSLTLRCMWIVAVCWFWQTLPLKLVWLSSLHGLLSGTSTVFGAIAVLCFADLATRDNRAKFFMLFGASNMGFNFVAPLLAAPLMTLDPWVPMFLSAGSLVLCTLMALIIPETLGYIHHDNPGVPVASLPTDLLAPPLGIPPAPRPFPYALFPSIRRQSAFLLADARILLLVLPFLISTASLATTDLLLQFCSTRFHMTLAAASVYTGVSYGLRALALLTALPAATHALATLPLFRRWSGPMTRDLVLLRLSCAAPALGWLVISLAPDPATYVAGIALLALGAGTTSLARAFVTELVRAHDRGKLYTFVSMVDTLALMLAGPVMARLWERGLELGGGVTLGLPFWIQAALYAVVTAAVSAVRVSKAEEHPTPTTRGNVV